MVFDKRLEELADDSGVNFYGIADLSAAHAAIIEQGGATVSKYPRAISFGITLFDSIIDQLPWRAERTVAVSYQHHCYDVINNRLDLVASRLSSELQGYGFDAMPIPASKSIDDEKLLAVFSHKMAAHLAGMGWIGKNCLMVTPEKGTRVRWATVLTNAPLTITGQPMVEQCGECDECIEICPVNAFTGEPFRMHENREVRYDAHKCNRYFSKLEEQGELAVCGLCLYICPIGRQ